MRRAARVSLPSAAAGTSRLVQLAVLLVLLSAASGDARAALVSGFAVLSSFAILTDSGAAPFLLQTPPDRLGRAVHARATAFHLVLAAAGAGAALVVVAASPGERIGPEAWIVLAALAVSGACDSATRTTRAPLLVQRRDDAYAVPELVLAVSKVPLLVWAWATASALPLAGFALVSVLVLAAAFARARRALPEAAAPRRLYGTILEFGVSGSLSSLYSQAPLVVGTLVLGVAGAEPLAVAYRLVQPIEFLPATASAQLIPRLRSGQARPAAWLGVFAGAGALAAAVLCALFAPLDAVTGGALIAPVFFAVAVSALPKFSNYLLVAVAMASGFIVQRLVATAAVAVAAVAAAVLAARTGGAPAVAVVTVGSELLLFALLGALVLARLRARRRAARVVGAEAAA